MRGRAALAVVSAEAGWNLSDRATPRSCRMTEGFGVHTVRLVDAEGATILVTFRWKPRLGVKRAHDVGRAAPRP